MISFFQPLLLKAGRLSRLWWQILLLLLIGIVIKSFVLVFWDVGATTMLLENQLASHIGIDFLGVSVLMAWAGFYITKLSRRKGFGITWLIAGCFLTLTGILWLGESWLPVALADVVFMIKYPLTFILTAAYWLMAKRFVPVRFDSLKFLVLFCADLFATLVSGSIFVFSDISAGTALLTAVFGLMILTAIFRVLTFLVPVPRETFIKKNDGVRKNQDQGLIYGILSLALTVTASQALMEGIFYTCLQEATTVAAAQTLLGLVWSLLGLTGLVMVGVLRHTRYIYTTLTGMLILAGSVLITGILAGTGKAGFIASGYFVFRVCSYFYLNGYLTGLPKPLISGRGIRLNKRIQAVAVPLGFILTASVMLNCDTDMQQKILVLMGGLIGVLIILTAILYSRALLRLLKMRFWRGAPLMIVSGKSSRYLTELTKEKSPNTVIYALRSLEIANHPAYETCLLKSMKHPSETVRLFALRKIRLLYRFSKFKGLFETTMKKDVSNSVRCRALSNLILIESQTSDGQPQKYLHYLESRRMRAGAVAGFLRVGGDLALSAMDILQKMARSPSHKENLTSLKLMAEVPSPAFVKLVSRLSRSPSVKVVRQSLLTAGRMRDPQLLAFVLKSLDNTDLQEYALESLKLYGKAAFPPLEKMLFSNKTPFLRRKVLISYLGSLPSGEGKRILMRALNIENQKLRKCIIQNIMDSGIIWIHREKKSFLMQCLKKDLDRITWLLRFRDRYSEAPTQETAESIQFLMRAIQEDINDTRDLILYQLLLLKDNPLFGKAIKILLGTNYELYLPALGLVQDILPTRLYQSVKSVLMLPLSPPKKESVITPSVQETVLGIAGLIQTPPFYVNHWIRATALYALRRLDCPEGISVAEHALNDHNPLVLEAAIWALVRLQPDKEKLHRQVLTLPTSHLAGISLDKIFES